MPCPQPPPSFTAPGLATTQMQYLSFEESIKDNSEDYDSDIDDFLDMFHGYTSDSITFEQDRRAGIRRRCLVAEDGREVHHVLLSVGCNGPSHCKAIWEQAGCDKSAFLRISRKRCHVFNAKLDKKEVTALKGHDQV